MKTDYDIVIIGGGSMGLATAAELANSDKRVIVLERFIFLMKKEALQDYPDN